MMAVSQNKENIRDYRDVVLRRKDPFGFWFLEGSDGKSLSQEAFTNLAEARMKVDEILNSQSKVKKK